MFGFTINGFRFEGFSLYSKLVRPDIYTLVNTTE